MFCGLPSSTSTTVRVLAYQIGTKSPIGKSKLQPMSTVMLPNFILYIFVCFTWSEIYFIRAKVVIYQLLCLTGILILNIKYILWGTRTKTINYLTVVFVILQCNFWPILKLIKIKQYICFNVSCFRSYRYASYLQFTWWMHGRLGKRIRRVIPSCAVNKIRHVYPEPGGIYTGFVNGDTDNDEVDEAWRNFNGTVSFRCEYISSGTKTIHWSIKWIQKCYYLNKNILQNEPKYELCTVLHVFNGIQ